MKSVLFATSALVAFAGAASAEVAVSGDARIGLRYENQAVGCVYVPGGTCADGGWNVVNRVRVKFAMSGETDSGLSFGADVRADESSLANNSKSTGTGVVWIKGSYGKLSAGDVDSALENAVGDLPSVGLTGLNWYNEFSYPLSDTGVDGDTNDATLLYEYKINDVSIYASFQDGYYGYSTQERGSAWSLGAGYTMGNYTFGLGYEQADFTPSGAVNLPNDHRTFGISGGTSINGITVKAAYVNTKIDGITGGTIAADTTIDQYGLGAEYKMANGVGLSGFWKHHSTDVTGVANSLEDDFIGIGAAYDLGGGAVVKGGIARASGDSYLDAAGKAKDVVVADFGVALSF